MNTALIIGEFLGKFILVIAIFMTGNPIYIAAAFLAAITIASKVSGGHINPVVTLAMVLNKTVNTADAIQYIAPQVAGAVAAFYVYKQLTPA